MSIGEVAERLRRFTVHLRGAGGRRSSAGSGVVWRSDGAILTNAHVVQDRTFLSAELWDGRTFPAKVTGIDPGHDLASLRIEASALPHAILRDTPIRPGEKAIAVGNPLGFTGAMTTGEVIAVGAVSGLGSRPWIQTAIRLAPGSSGGPLADVDGKLVGINAMVVANGIALSIPATVARNFAVNGPPPRLGISLREVAYQQDARGLLILGIETGGLADGVSLMIGDILISLNGARLESYADLSERLADSSTEYARMQFLRGDRRQPREVVIRLRERLAA